MSSKSHRSSLTPADVITYRYNEKMVYVPVAQDYPQALAHVRDAFPQLKKFCDASLSLSLTSPGHDPRFVGISAPAWPKLVPHMLRYQVVDVHVVPASIPDITITYADADNHPIKETECGLPPYPGANVVEDEKAPCPRQRSLSMSTFHLSRRSWLLPKLNDTSAA